MSAKPVLLPAPEISPDEIPPGTIVVKFNTLCVRHPYVIGAHTPLMILAPNNPDLIQKMNEIGRIATATGRRFRSAMSRAKKLQR